MVLCWGLRRLGLKKDVLVMKLGVKVGIGEAGKSILNFWIQYIGSVKIKSPRVTNALLMLWLQEPLLGACPGC